MELKAIKISKYGNTFSMLNSEVSLLEELDLIRTGYYGKEILACRAYLAAGDAVGYKAAKKSLPALTFSGAFDGAHKRDNLRVYSSLIVIDIDNLDTNLNELKSKLEEDEYIISVWMSPSGNGLKALIAVDIEPVQHKIAFDQLLDYFKKKYDLDIDKTGSDICRLCYVSYDEDLKIKDDFSVFKITPGEPIEIPQIKTDKASIVFYDKKDIQINSSYNKRLFLRLLKYLQTRKLSITKSYEDWYRVALAISNSFNPDLGKRYFLELSRLDENFDEYKCLELLDYCYRHKRDGAISFRTIIFMAKAHGFNE